MPPSLRTKIVCTLGSRDPSDPALPQNAPDFVDRLSAAGMSVARINLSHNRSFGGAGGFEEEDRWLDAVERVNAAAGDAGPRVAVIADLQGVKLRLAIPPGARRAGWALAPGDRVGIGLAPGAAPPCVDGGPALADDVRRGLAAAGPEGLLLHVGDGETLLRVEGVDAAGVLRAEVVVGGTIFDRKGVTFRGVRITVDSVLTGKDRHDLARWVLPGFLAGRIHFAALSFVRGPEDVRTLRGLAEGLPVVAKIETREAAEAAPAILRESDGVMVARGDLGLQCEAREVPRLQKEILRAAARAGKPAIVATQMLDSMERSWEPRRPEASDVFNAVLDGADAVMLSGETSVGVHPVRAVEVLRGIASAAEAYDEPSLGTREADLARFYEAVRAERAWHGPSAAVTDHASYLAALTAPLLGARAIVAVTLTGGTARMVARFRPRVPVYACVHHAAVARRLSLSRGVIPVETPLPPAGTPVDRVFEAALKALRDRGLLSAGDRVVLLCGRPFGAGAGTNLISIEGVP